ncbi:hypothetical protein SO802_026078 [Lithocarpus litseifolius]|uniref:RNase H type-1 domain-containing protein n=1 Tax=Lithocarpus litseifolius TaxID=425828 RepID=A0AAW2C062_9ROSI
MKNDKGEVMAASSARGDSVSGSEEAEVLACRHAVEFALGLGFRELVIEGDNATIMRNITDFTTSSSHLDPFFLDIHSSLAGLSWFSVSFIYREGNFVADSLAWFARHVYNDVIWIEDSPPPALESLYFDLAHIAF